jgi:hypothetical protein
MSQQPVSVPPQPHPNALRYGDDFESRREASMPYSAAAYAPVPMPVQSFPPPDGSSFAAFEMLKAQLEVSARVHAVVCRCTCCFALHYCGIRHRFLRRRGCLRCQCKRRARLRRTTRFRREALAGNSKHEIAEPLNKNRWFVVYCRS